MKKSIAAALALTFTSLPVAVVSEAVEDPNYTTQNLMIFNDRGEVLLQRNFMGWSTPGTRYDQRVSLRKNLDELASRYGLTVRDVRLSGLFSYQYSYTPAISTRSHYSAIAAGGAALAPKGIDEVRWFARKDAIAAIASDTQRSPQALVEISRQMLDRPDTIWSAAFYIWKDGETYRSKVVESMDAIG